MNPLIMHAPIERAPIEISENVGLANIATAFSGQPRSKYKQRAPTDREASPTSDAVQSSELYGECRLIKRELLRLDRPEETLLAA